MNGFLMLRTNCIDWMDQINVACSIHMAWQTSWAISAQVAYGFITQKQSPSVQLSTPGVPAHGKEELAKDSLALLSMPSNEVEDRICNSFEQDNSSQGRLQSQAVGESWPINYNQWVGN